MYLVKKKPENREVYTGSGTDLKLFIGVGHLLQYSLPTSFILHPLLIHTSPLLIHTIPPLLIHTSSLPHLYSLPSSFILDPTAAHSYSFSSSFVVPPLIIHVLVPSHFYFPSPLNSYPFLLETPSLSLSVYLLLKC